MSRGARRGRASGPRRAPASPAAAALAALLAGLLACAAPAGQAQPTPSAGEGGAAAGLGGVPLTVLLFHPDDGVDPLGFTAAEGDPFGHRYAPLVASKGRFDFPFFVADGVLPIEAIPDPARPYDSALGAYTQAVEARAAREPAATLRLSSLAAEGQVAVQVRAEPRASLAGEDVHLRVALVEDHVEYQPPPGLTNGITDHRFTVRAYADLGRLDGPAPHDAAHTFLLQDGWERQELSVAAWLQQDAPSPRFDAREVLQATHAPVGASAVQAGRGVLAEMLSATWCDPCLYGDRAIEALAVRHGVADAAEARPAARYLDLSPRDGWALAAAGLAGLALALAARRGA